MKNLIIRIFAKKKKKSGGEILKEMAQKLSFYDSSLPKDLSSNDDYLYSKESHYGTHRF